MDLSLLKTLRQKIATSKVFADVFEYFYDHFGENPEFFDAGEPTEDEMLQGLLGQVGGALSKPILCGCKNMRLIRIKEYNFIHGGMTINGAMANVIYCDDTKQGIVAIHMPAKNQPTQFIRFSAEMLAPNLAAEATKFKH